MAANTIFLPMLSMFTLTFLVWFYMFAKRIPWIQRSELTEEQLQPLNFQALQPADVASPSDNLKNLFEMPVLFYFLCTYLYAVQQVDTIHVICAWAYFGLRLAHSTVHCTVNIVMLRFVVYALSCGVLLVMLLRALLNFGAVAA